MEFLKIYTREGERTVFLGEQAVVLGRDTSCDIVLEDPKASRMHCTIEPCGDGRWRVRDLDSGNGTRVNGCKVDRRVLAPGEVVKIGDVRLLFAGEGASAAGEARPGARAPRRAASRSRLGLALAGCIALAVVVALFALRKRSPPPESAAAVSAFRTVMAQRSDEDRVRLGESFLAGFPESSRAPAVRLAVEAARKRLLQEAAGSAPGASANRSRKRVSTERERRERFFEGIEGEFKALVAKGEFARARELWFFLNGEKDWQPIPAPFPDRIVADNRALETRAAAARGELFDGARRREAQHDLRGAVHLIRKALPRFQGTAVERSLRERLALLRETIHGARREHAPGPAHTVVEAGVEKRLRAQLARMEQRDFAAAAQGLRALAEELKKGKERGYAEVAARARECGAAAALQQAVAAELAAGKPPQHQLLNRWRVLSGGTEGVVVRFRGAEHRYSWREVPPPLFLALLERRAPRVRHGFVGLVVAAAAVGGEKAALPLLARAYAEDAAERRVLDVFVAARLRNEALPEGGYVVAGGAIHGRKAFLLRQEKERIASLRADLDAALKRIKAAAAFKKLAKLATRKNELDQARTYALKLIFDEKRYFYPYRGTGRMGEYTKVQQEVDRRVEAVRGIWEDRTLVHVRASPELKKELARFDNDVAELKKRLVDVQDRVAEVAFLRSYLGRKLTVRNFYRTPEEFALLRYSDEVMEYNTTVPGDITPPEREQVRITNEYRMMFGRWAVRLVDKLVLSVRGHCEEMSRLGYFGHFSSTPGRRTPYDRMKLAGYAYGASENLIMGRTNPQAAHDGWCHSSGHHRNILMAPWTEMGTGQYGRYMGQNYGIAPRWSKFDVAKKKPAAKSREWEEDEDPGWIDPEEDGKDDKDGEGEPDYDYGDDEG